MKLFRRKRNASKTTAKRNFIKDEDGIAAVEFAMIAFPFFLILFSIMEIALVFFGRANIEYATAEAARLIRTGQAQNGDFTRQTDPNTGEAQTGSITKAEFKKMICNNVFLVTDCENKVGVEIKSFTGFEDINPDVDLAYPIQNGAYQAGQDFTFNPPGSCQPAVVRAFIEWDLIAQVPGIGVSNLDNGNLLITGASIFQSEPYAGGCP